MCVKNKLFLCLFLLFFSSHSVAEQNFVNLKIRPITFLMGLVNLEVEVPISDKFSIGPTVYYNEQYTYVKGREGEQYTEIITSLGLNSYFYLNKALESSWFVSPFIHYTTWTTNYYLASSGYKKTVNEKFKSSAYPIVGATVGYQWFSKNHYNAAIEAGSFWGGRYAEGFRFISLSVGKAFSI